MGHFVLGTGFWVTQKGSTKEKVPGIYGGYSIEQETRKTGGQQPKLKDTIWD